MEAKTNEKSNDKVLLFIPMYNCEKQIVRVLSSLNEKACSYFEEILVVDNRSTDTSLSVAADFVSNGRLQGKDTAATVVRNKQNYGLGGSHKVAFQYAIDNGFDYLVVLHGDDQASIADLLPSLESGIFQDLDRFLGSRFMKGSSLEGYSRFRTFGNRVYNRLFSFASGRRVLDLGAGLNMYSVSSLKDRYWLKFGDSLMFDYYMVLADGFYGKRVNYFPITWREEDQVSNVKLMNQATKTLELLNSYRRDKAGFMTSEHRERIIDKYDFEVVFSSK